ncbi:MAG: hypothetical protein WEA54_03250 [Actinomycetota bacterium]
MIAYIVKRLAVAILVIGVVGAIALPSRELTFCARFSFLECGSDPQLYMRWALVGVGALVALFIATITWAIERARL